jgi:NAD(P)H-flavin reductase
MSITAGMRDYLPQLARIAASESEAHDTRTFVLALDPPASTFDTARPGQFVMLSVFGHGEAAFTLSSLPCISGARGTVVVTVRRIGALTTALFALKEGARVGVRGPFGRGFPDGEADRPTIYVAGGCGLSPLKAAIDAQIAERTGSAPLAIVYGAREPDARIHRMALASWGCAENVHVLECVERAARGWTGRLGGVALYVEEAARTIGAERAAVCGPPAMLPVVATRLERAGLDPDRIHIAVERYMKCGTGHCGHCYVNQRYVCTDGPVFSFAELRRLSDAFAEIAPERLGAAC